MTVARYDTELVHPESREKGPFDLIWRGTFTLPTHNFQPQHGNNKMPNVPSQRKFLTTLIKNLASTQSAHTSSVAEGSSHLPPASRPLLLTLHVLFPSLLLPALDLLDRRLVTHLIVPGQQAGGEHATETHIVKSVGTTIARRRNDSAAVASSSSSSLKRSYVVSLRAWNCSCASFAFDAFPAAEEAADQRGDERMGTDWEFGSMSLDGLSGVGEDVPCCKHLLACLLAMEWGEVLGSYVERKEVSREEYAGTVAAL